MAKHSYLARRDIIPIWSNVPLYVPAIIAASKGLFWYGFLIAMATTVSLLYHLSKETRLKKTDQALAYTVIAANLFVLYLARFPQPYFMIALAFVGLALYFFLTGKEHKYDVRHGLWHLCSVIITLMSVLAY